VRASVVTGPGAGRVQEVPDPVAAAGEVVVDVEQAGVCGGQVGAVLGGRRLDGAGPGPEILVDMTT
jgi:threonine dehydrogenase-like Zn-dependent dehydrogenase